jgi:hypothetical protein
MSVMGASPHRRHSLYVNLRHSSCEFACQLPATQMNVKYGRLNISVPCEHRDLMDFPVRSRQIGQAQIPESMRREARQVALPSHAPDYLRPRRDRNRSSSVPTRLRQEQGARFSAKLPAFAQDRLNNSLVGTEYGTIRSRRFFLVSERMRKSRWAGSTSRVSREQISSRRKAASRTLPASLCFADIPVCKPVGCSAIPLRSVSQGRR